VKDDADEGMVENCSEKDDMRGERAERRKD
jgi:hypothetical protein